MMMYRDEAVNSPNPKICLCRPLGRIPNPKIIAPVRTVGMNAKC